MIDRQLAGTVHPNGTTLVLLLTAVLLSLGFLYPLEVGKLTTRLTSVKLGGVLELALREVERSVAVERLPETEEYGSTPIPPLKRTGTTQGDLDEVRACLVDRLTWLARELELDAGHAADVVQQLRTREFLDAQQASFAMDLVTAGRADIASLPGGVQEQYIDRAWRFANALRPTVFDRAVRDDLRHHGWFIADFKQIIPGHRPDFLASADGRWVLVAARIALDCDSAVNEKSGQIAKTKRRWRLEGGAPISLAARVIVIPENSDAPESDGAPAVVKRPRLSDSLDRIAPRPGLA